MVVVRGIGIALAIFLVSFVLHIVGGATDQGWLFAIAVGLIFVSATGFPVIALWMAELRSVRSEQGRMVVSAGGVIGYALTVATLWAANGRAFAWWEFPLAVVLVCAVSLALAWIGRAWLILRGKDQPRRTPRIRKSERAESEEPVSSVARG